MIKKIPYLLVFLFLVFLSFLPFLIKVKFECQSQFGECPTEISSKLQTLNSKNLFVAKKESIKILKTSQLVSNFSSQYKLPNILEVNLVIKKPYFALKSSVGGAFGLIDQSGIVISTTANSSLPVVLTGSAIPKVGEKITDRDFFALILVSGMYEMYQVGYGTIENDALVVDMPTGLRVIFPLEGNSEILLGGLRLIYSKVTGEFAGTYSQIDMRYKNPVLR